MSVATLTCEIEAMRTTFNNLNALRGPFCNGGHRPLKTDEEITLGKLADEIARMQMTKSVLAAEEMMKMGTAK